MSSSLVEIQKKLEQYHGNCQILAVSKLQSVDKIRQLYSAGQRSFGENYVQEALDKQQQLQDLKIDWHFIGSLQTNKVKFVVGHFSKIHSVDSFRLAEAIQKQSQKLQIRQEIFVQVNLSRELTKGGLGKEELDEFLKRVTQFPNVLVSGLMTMPPLFEAPEEARPFFHELNELLKKYQPFYPHLKFLSMGTSSDYLVAASEGAHWVRLGTVLFGERIAP